MKRYEFPDNGKYIYKRKNGNYQIIKKYRKNGKMIHKFFGSFSDYNDAIIHRDKCIEGNWDESLKYENPMKHITKNGKGWQIQRDHRGKHYYFGTFSNLIDAMNERDLLVKYDWDVEKICECHDETIEGTSVFRRRM